MESRGKKLESSAASRGDFYFTLEGIYGFRAAVCYHGWLGAKRNCDLGAGGREFKSRRPDRRRGPGSGAFPVVAEAAGTSTPSSVSTVGWLDFANETDATRLEKRAGTLVARRHDTHEKRARRQVVSRG